MGCKHTSWQQLYDEAQVPFQQGYYAKTAQQAEEGYRLAQNKDLLWSWKFRILEADSLMRDQQLKAALDLLAEDPPTSLPVEIRVHKRIVQAQTLCRAEKNQEAHAILDETEKLVPSNSPQLQAELAYDRGYCSFNKPVTSRQYFEKVAELAHATDPFLAAGAFNNIGYLLDNQGHHDEAIDFFQKVLPLAQAVKSKILQEKAMGNLGFSYSELGDFKQSIDYSDQAQNIASEIGRLDDKESWLVNLGRSYAAMVSDYPGKAEAAYLSALSISEKLHDKRITTLCLHDLAQIGLTEHNLDKAKSYFRQEVANISPGEPAETYAWADEAQIAVAEKNFDKSIGLLRRIDQDARPTLVLKAFIESTLAQVYWAQHKNSEAERAFLKSIQTVEQELSKTKEQYWASILDGQGHRFDYYIRFLLDQGRSMQALDQVEYERQLALNLRLDPQRPPLNIAAIQRRLARNQVILDYHVTDEESFLWVITATRVQLFHLPSHPELHYLLEAHTNEIQGQRAIEDSPGGQKLYKALIQPAEKLIPSGAQVSIIPSKILWLLNFETLIVPGPRPHYWIEDVAIQNWSSLSRAATDAGSSTRAQKQMLLIGAPEEVNPTFPTLKHANEEIGEIKSQFVSDHEQVISGSAATPQAYLSSAPEQYRFIHFVTHGIPNEKIPLESAIVLSGTTSSYKLYARDIVAKPIHADLVTISACYGAGKRWYIAEGVVGLGWAFIRAGAHQVIAALWEVDDSTTPDLMNTLYTELNHHHTAADALRSAKLSMLHASGPRKLPYYWGSLQLYTRS